MTSGGLRCPPIQQCISINHVDNNGSISGGISMNTSNNCSFKAAACKDNQYLATVECPDCTNKTKQICQECPDGKKPNNDHTSCVYTNSPTPSPNPTPSPGQGNSSGTVVKLKLFVEKFKTWIKNNKIKAGAIGTAASIAIVAILFIMLRSKTALP